MSEYPYTIAATDANALSREFSAALGRQVVVTYTTPGQTDAEGNEIPAVLWVSHPNGVRITVDPAEVERLLKAHVPPLPPETPEQRRARLKAAIDNAGSLAAMKPVLKTIVDAI